MLGDNFFTTFFTCLGNKLSGATSPSDGSIIDTIFIMHESQEVTSGVMKKVTKNCLPCCNYISSRKLLNAVRIKISIGTQIVPQLVEVAGC